jgi:flagellar basal body-associated protein FliL
MKKLKIIIPVLLLVGGFVGYTKFLKKPPPEPKVHGEVYVLPKDFVLNLKDGRFLKVGVGLLVEAGDPSIAAGGGGHGGGAAPPEGYGPMPQEALVRDIVVDHLTDVPADDLIDREERHEIKEAIAKDLRKRTDVKVEEVLFTDVAVQ